MQDESHRSSVESWEEAQNRDIVCRDSAHRTRKRTEGEEEKGWAGGQGGRQASCGREEIPSARAVHVSSTYLYARDYHRLGRGGLLQCVCACCAVSHSPRIGPFELEDDTRQCIHAKRTQKVVAANGHAQGWGEGKVREATSLSSARVCSRPESLMIEAGERAIAGQKTESAKNGERHCGINDGGTRHRRSQRNQTAAPGRCHLLPAAQEHPGMRCCPPCSRRSSGQHPECRGRW